MRMPALIAVLVLLLSAAFTSAPVSTRAAELAVAPQFFDVRQSQGGETTGTLEISNRSQIAAVVTVQAGQFYQLITPEPAQFRLDGGQRRMVSLSFAKLPAGVYATDLIVQARDIGSNPQNPPAEIRVPARFDISREPGAWHAQTLIVAFLLVVAMLILLVFIYSAPIKYHLAVSWNRLRAKTDGWILKQSSLRPYIVGVTCLALVLTTGLVIWGMSSANDPANIAPANATDGYQYEVAITTPNLHQLFQLESEQPLTAFAALQKVSAHYTIPIDFQSSDMGVFVTSIGGTVNGSDHLYWVYEVNGQKIPLASNAYVLQSQDHLVWKFTKPE